MASSAGVGTPASRPRRTTAPVRYSSSTRRRLAKSTWSDVVLSGGADCSRATRSSLVESGSATPADRARMLEVLKAYLAHEKIEANWKAIEDADDARLVASLAMMCPFQASEKQALLEAPDLAERARVVVALLEMALVTPGDGSASSKQ